MDEARPIGWWKVNSKNRTHLPTSLEKFMMIEDDGVFYVGHASALIRMGGKLFLFDPIWDAKPYGDYWSFFPKQINCDQVLDKLYSIFISHIHEDHLCDEILARTTCPIDVMRGRKPLEDRLRAVAGDRVFTSQPFRWHKLNNADVEFYYVPHAFNSIDSSIFIRSKDYCVYVGSDNFLSKELLVKIAQDIPKVDVAMVPYAFIHWYPHLLNNITDEERETETKRLNKQSLDQAREFIDTFRPETVVPFGSNLFYAAGMDHILNRSLAKPEDLTEYPMKTGDFILKGGARHDDKTDEPFDEKEFPTPDYEFEVDPGRMYKVAMRIEENLPRVMNHTLIVNGVCIDFEDLTVAYKMVKTGREITAFFFDEPVFKKWLEGTITFEQAIGTRRFTCRREPNKYNLKVFEFMNNFL